MNYFKKLTITSSSSTKLRNQLDSILFLLEDRNRLNLRLVASNPTEIDLGPILKRPNFRFLFVPVKSELGKHHWL